MKQNKHAYPAASVMNCDKPCPHRQGRLWYRHSRNSRSLGIALLLVMLFPLLSACFLQDEPVDSYVALAPKNLYSGQNSGVSLSLFRGEALANSSVTLALVKDGQTLFQTREMVPGKGTLAFQVPELTEGQYELAIYGNGFSDKAPVQVLDSSLIFLQTDKPIYKPGQTIHLRAITLDADLKPVSARATIEAMDAKGTKVLRKEVTTGEFGMATLDLPLSTEPNLGTWKLTAATGKQKSQLDVKVEKYVLPKYEVKLEMAKDWYLANEVIKGELFSEYSFGKPVAGEVQVKASRYTGQWQQYASITRPIDGKTSFEIPAAQYVAGVPGARGMGQVLIDVTVREKATGYEEKTNRLVTIAPSPLTLQLIPENPVFKPSLPFKVLLLAGTPDNKPKDTTATVRINYLAQGMRQIRSEQRTLTTQNGKAMLELAPPQDAAIMQINASADRASTRASVGVSYSPTGNFIHLEQTSPGVPKVGEQISFKVYSTREAANFYYEVISRGRVVFSSYEHGDSITFQTSPLMAPSSKILVYQILPNSEIAADDLPFKVTGSYPHSPQVKFSKGEVRPGEEVDISVGAEGKAEVGLQVVHRSVFILAENRLNLKQVFDELEKLYMKPQVEIHSASLIPPVVYKGAREAFADNGVTVMTNKTVPSGEDEKKKLQKQQVRVQPGPAGRAGPAGPPGGENMAIPAPAATRAP
ncbi:MAG: hypothetical protein HY673_08580, partial [Chloroflexi bacterium]|nr:hypothetical protein [Chloroflexota bacterium]